MHAAIVTLVLSLALVPRFGDAADAGVTGKKLIITDKTAKNGKVSIVFLAKGEGVASGPAGDPGELDATLDVFYTDDPSFSRFGRSRLTMARNTTDPPVANWVEHDKKTKYLDKTAPDGGPVKLALVKPGKLAKVVGKALGDDAANSIDLATGGAPSADGGITVMLTIYNRIDGSLHRMCTRFATADGSKVKVKEIAGGTGRKLIAKKGAPVPCTLDYTNDRFWLCRPGMAENQCQVNSLDAISIGADGSSVAEAFVGSDDHPYDCFYVYPTVHLAGDGTAEIMDDVLRENDALLNQAARFGDRCRMFAPLYRQVWLTTSTDRGKFGEVGYRDVKAAWDDYLANHNGGRNVVVMGHSQGASMVTRLMQEEIDPNPTLRARLITALLIGGSVFVPRGEVVGGSFQNIPVCTTDAQTGCVLAYRSYGEPTPPTEGSNSLSSTDNDRVCTNPAALGGGEGRLSGFYVTTSSSQPIYFGIVDLPLTGAPFVKWPDLYVAECVPDADGFTYLQIKYRPLPGGVRPDVINYTHPALAPSFLGTHILDVQFGMGDLLGLVAAKAAAMP